jgi:hypothetical protein
MLRMSAVYHNDARQGIAIVSVAATERTLRSQTGSRDAVMIYRCPFDPLVDSAAIMPDRPASEELTWRIP